MKFVLLLLLSSTFWLSLSSDERCYQLSIEPDVFPNDISWTVYQQLPGGVLIELESGDGDSNKFKSDCYNASSSECFAFTVSDSYGDGFCCHPSFGSGYTNITYNSQLQQIEGRVYSDEYNNGGYGPYQANETYLFEDGEWVEYCRYGASHATQGCDLDLSIDIVFVFDTSFDLSNDFWREKLFARYILSDNVPDDTRVGSITFATTYTINFNLTQNSEDLRKMIDDETAQEFGQQYTS